MLSKTCLGCFQTNVIVHLRQVLSTIGEVLFCRISAEVWMAIC